MAGIIKNSDLETSKALDEIRAKATPILKKHGVARASLFGSAALGDAGRDSDIDLLIEYREENLKTYFDLMSLQKELSAKLGRNIDLAFFDCIKDRIRPSVLSQQVPLF